ncbi:MAG: hypothetical protein IKD45_05400 [Clostridia bacterium]|nr:hypothetical protein [Clostridia bacterium]
MKKRSYKLKIMCALLLISCLLSSAFSVSADASGADITDRQNESRVASRIIELIFGSGGKKHQNEDIYLCPGGDAFGVKICGGTVSVSRVIDTASNGDFRENDIIKSIDGKEISSIDDIKEHLRASGGRELQIEVLREGKHIFFNTSPSFYADEYHLGVLLKDGATGIGTITYYDPKTASFGGLGHGIATRDGKEIIKATGGKATGVILSGAKRGEANTPGELRGVLTDRIIGTVEANTECGVFGTLASPASVSTEAIPIARKNEVAEGAATVITTVRNGKRASYSIEITDIDYSSDGTKSFKIRVTDDTLIAITGGIVRGMSGSPIIQDGKLVGAVTHVLVANPTEGYGIFIENMLNASEVARNELPKAA